MSEKNQIFISIIVAVYNTDKYLKECLDSLINQTLRDIEIIIVNDGSTDNSQEILKKYADTDDRIKLITKKNQGQSIARNIGLEYANGEYIGFVDSDDYIDLNTYEKLYKFAKKHDHNMVVYDALRFNSKKLWRAKIHRKSISKECIPSTNIIEKNNLVYDTCVWNKLIKKTFWDEHKFSFLPGRLYEDVLVSAQLHCNADFIGIYPKVRYYWRLREGDNKSTTQNTTSIKNLHDRTFIINKLTELFKSDSKYKKLLLAHYNKCAKYDLPIFINNVNKSDEKFQNELINCLNPLLKEVPLEVFKELNFSNKIKYHFIMKKDLINLKKIVSYDKYSNKKRYSKLMIILISSIKDRLFIEILKFYLKNRRDDSL